MNFEEQVEVTIWCTVYNHYPYLKRTLDGFINQKTNFKYKVVINDDASTDGSQEILKEYEGKYKDIFNIHYQPKNLYSQKIKISPLVLYPEMKGKYLAFCEGDDYWCDEHKLQECYDVLEAHPECSMCVHKTAKIYEDGTKSGRYFPPNDINSGIINAHDYVNMEGMQTCFQNSSFFIRSNIMSEYFKNMPEYAKKCMVGDYCIELYVALYGDIFYINKTLSCYRMTSKGSWSERYKKANSEKLIDIFQNRIDTYKRFNEYSNYKFEEEVEKSIYWNEFKLLETSKKYSDLLKNKYRLFFNKRSWRFKLRCYVNWLLHI